MIDSIDYIIKDVEYVDFKYLRNIGINDISSFHLNNIIGNLTTNYRWSYKTVEFKYYPSTNTVVAYTNTHKILNKLDITLTDKTLYESLIHNIFINVFANETIKYELDRLDYYVDIKLADDMILQKYLMLYQFQMPKYGHTKLKNIYPTSIYRSSRRGQYNINIYSKFQESSDERYRNVLRIELQMKRPKIKKEYEKNGISKELSNYWNKEAMEEYYFNYYRNFFGTGKHMKYTVAAKIINRSDLSSNWKKKLKRFLKARMFHINNTGIVKAKQTVDKYIAKLGELNINALCMPEVYETFFPNVDGIDNLLDLAYTVAVKKYFL